MWVKEGTEAPIFGGSILFRFSCNLQLHSWWFLDLPLVSVGCCRKSLNYLIIPFNVVSGKESMLVFRNWHSNKLMGTMC